MVTGIVMGPSRNSIEAGLPLSLFIAPVFLMWMFGCAERHRNPVPVRLTLNETKAELIRQLDAAEQTDECDARDPRISLIRKEDFFEQAYKAQRAKREFLYGYSVSHSEMTDALAVPPKTLSPQAKADLIRQIDDTIALNDHREQARLNDYFSASTVDTDSYDTQKSFAAAVLKEFTIGEDVHWDTLQQALQVLPLSNSSN